MSKKEVIKFVAAESGLTQAKVSEVHDLIIDGIVEMLQSKGEYKITDFGKFVVKVQKPRKVTPPGFDKPITTKEKNVVRFQIFTGLKELINQ